LAVFAQKADVDSNHPRLFVTYLKGQYTPPLSSHAGEAYTEEPSALISA